MYIEIIVDNITHKRNISNSLYNNLSFVFGEKDKVPDSQRGYLACINGMWQFCKKEEKAKGKYINENILAIVLESPHKDEYDSEGNPLLPAQGKTGKMIDKNLIHRKEITDNLNKDIKYKVILVNPIQYQASGYKVLKNNSINGNRNLTNMIFRALFSKRGHNLREDFICRLKKYKPNIIINACTSSLKGTVEKSIKEAGFTYSVKEYHPSKW